MQVRLERSGELDANGNIYAPDCFKGSDGKRVPVFIGSDSDNIVGFATLREKDGGLLADLEERITPHLPNHCTVSMGYRVDAETVGRGRRTVDGGEVLSLGIVPRDPPAVQASAQVNADVNDFGER